MHFIRIRFLRNLLIALIALLSMAVLANYLQKWRQRSSIVKPVREILSADLSRSATKTEYITYESGMRKFRLLANKLLETREGKALLEGIEANDYNPDGSERNQITSRNCEYDKDEKKVVFSGDVRLHLEKDMHIQMETLYYSIADQTGHSDGLIRLDSPQAAGTAQGIRYRQADRRIELLKDLNFTIRRSITQAVGDSGMEEYKIAAEYGIYSEPELVMRMTGGARLASSGGTLTGDRIDATVSPDQKRITSLVCQGNSSYEFQSPGDARTIRGDQIVFELGRENKALETIHVLGQASFTMTSPDGDQKLAGSEIHLKIDPVSNSPQMVQSIHDVRFEFGRSAQRTSGSSEWLEAEFEPASRMLDRVHVRDRALMRISGSNSGIEHLSAEDIRFSFRRLNGRSVPQALEAERSVRWTSAGRGPTDPGRTLSTASLTMRYSDQGDFLESCLASGGVTMTEAPAAGARNLQVRRLQCDRAEFGFYPNNNKLKTMTGHDNVQVLYRKPADPVSRAAEEEYRTSSAVIRAQFREADGGLVTLTQAGNFTFQGGTRTATAGNCDFSDASQIMVLTDHPRIKDPDSETSAEQIDFDRNAKVMIARRNVRSELNTSSGGSRGFLTSAQDDANPALVTANEMRYWIDQAKAQYSGNVRLLSADNQLQSKSLQILNRGESIEAEGEVRHLMQKFNDLSQITPKSKSTSSKPALSGMPAKTSDPVIIRSQRLQYSRASGPIRYAGNVTLDSKDYRMQSDIFEVFTDAEGKKVIRAKASGHVVLTQPGRELRGAEADYDPQTGIMVLTGDPAELFDYAQKDKPIRSKARRLTFYTTDGRILLGL